jgi:hypothetical protein
MFKIQQVSESLHAVVMDVLQSPLGKRKNEKIPYAVVLFDETGSMDMKYPERGGKPRPRYEYAREVLEQISKVTDNFSVLFFDRSITKIFSGNAEKERMLSYGTFYNGTDITEAMLECLQIIFTGLKGRHSQFDNQFNFGENHEIHLILITDGDDDKFMKVLQMEVDDTKEPVGEMPDKSYDEDDQTMLAIRKLMKKVTSFQGIGIGEVTPENMLCWKNMCVNKETCDVYKVTPDGLKMVTKPICELLADKKQDVQVEIKEEDGSVVSFPSEMRMFGRKVHFFEGKKLVIPDEQKGGDDLNSVVIPELVSYYLKKSETIDDLVDKVKCLDECASLVTKLGDACPQEKVQGLKRLGVVIASFKSTGDARQDAIRMASARVASYTMQLTDSIDAEEVDLEEVEQFSLGFAENPSGRSFSCALGFQGLRVNSEPADDGPSPSLPIEEPQ